MTLKTRFLLFFSALGRHSRNTRFAYGFILLALWCVTRWPWLDCDGGTPSLWEFGYFVTDEGYYLGGGKEKFCFGSFVELLRGEACTFGFSPGTHLLCWLSYLVFGLKSWAVRVPFFLINMVAYGSLFWFLARRTLPWIAFSLCCCVMFTPFMVVYERTASNDVLIASLFVMAYVASCGRSWTRIVLAGVLCALIALIKPSVYVLLPIVAGGILTVRKTRSRVLDVACFFAVFSSVIVLEKVALFSLLQPDALLNGVPPSEIITRTTSHYAFPSLLDFERVFCGLTTFPRYPANTLLSVWSVLLTVLPLTALSRCVCGGNRRFKWHPRLVMYLMVPAYCFAVAIMNTHYTHYFIPVMLFSPILWMEIRRDLRGGGGQSPWMFCVIILVAFLSGLCLNFSGYPPSVLQEAQNYAARMFNLPSKTVWLFNWERLLLWSLLIGGVGALGLWYRSFSRGKKRRFPIATVVLEAFALFAGVLLALSVCYSQLPLAILAPYIKFPQEAIGVNLRLCLMVSTFLILSVWLLPGGISRGRVWHLMLPLVFMVAIAVCPTWRQGAFELTARNHLYREAVKKLLSVIPPNALVIGERAPQLLLATSVKAASSFLFNCDPMPVVEAMAKKSPETPIIALLDREQIYNWQHYEQNKDKVTCRPFEKMVLPSFATGKPIDIYIAEIRVIKR